MKLKLFTLLSILCLSLTACGGGDGDGDGDHGACTSLKIANGETCESKEIPVVLLKIRTRSGDSICSGTIITKTSVLTAAHCVKGANQIEVVHRKGMVNVETAYYNSYFSYNSSYQLSPYDVAILKVPQGFTESIGITSTALELSDTIKSGQRLTIFGFGRDENNQISYNLPKAAYVTFNEVSEGHIITYAIDGYGKGGDSGGPLVYKNAIVGVLTGESISYPGYNFFANVRDELNYSFIMSLASDVATKSTIQYDAVQDGLATEWHPSSEE